MAFFRTCKRLRGFVRFVRVKFKSLILQRLDHGGLASYELVFIPSLFLQAPDKIALLIALFGEMLVLALQIVSLALLRVVLAL